MRTFMKIVAVVAVAAILIIVATTMFAKIFITPERVRAAVLPVVEKTLNRDVQLGDISIRLFSGIILHDLRIMERDSNETFISASSAALRYRLLPLLSLQVIIDELRLEEPYIRAVRLPGGTFNFSDLMASKEAPDPGGEPPVRTAPTAEPNTLPINLTIATVRLNRGTILFIDKTINPDMPQHYQISELNGVARSISLDKSFPFEFSCRINEASLSIEGHADILKQGINAQLKIDGLDATDFLPYFADQIPGRLSSLNLELNTNVTANLNQIVSSGTLALRDINLVLNDLADAPIRDAHLLVDFDISADLTASLLELRSTRINCNGIIAQVSGRIENMNNKPQLALDLRLPSLKFPNALTALPKELVADVLALDPSGVLDIQARIEGPFDQGASIIKNADVRLKNVQATAGGMRPNLNGSLKLTGDQLISEDLVMNAGGSQAGIDLSAKNLFDKPIITQHINAKRVDLDALLQTSASTPADNANKRTHTKVQSGSKEAQAAEEIGPFDLSLRVDGTVKIGEIVYKGLTINDFNLAYRLADNILTIEKMNGRTAGGSFKQNGRVDLGRKGLAYKTTLSMQDIQTDPVISAFMPQAAGIFFGDLNLDLEANGSGTLPETLKQNLTCTSRINLINGRITGSNLSQGLADFLSSNELRELTFSTFADTVAIKQGRALIDTEMDGTDIRMSPKGVVGLDGSLDVSLNAALSPNIMKKIDKRGKVSSYLTDQQGWNQLPLKITGNITQPRFSLDTIGLQKQAKERVFDILQQKLFGRDKDAEKEEKQADSPEQATSQPRQPEDQEEQVQQKESKKDRKKRRAARKELLEETLRGLLEP